MGSHSGLNLHRVRVIAQPIRHSNRNSVNPHRERAGTYYDLDNLEYEMKEVAEYVGAHRRRDVVQAS